MRHLWLSCFLSKWSLVLSALPHPSHFCPSNRAVILLYRDNSFTCLSSPMGNASQEDKLRSVPRPNSACPTRGLGNDVYILRLDIRGGWEKGEPWRAGECTTPRSSSHIVSYYFVRIEPPGVVHLCGSRLLCQTDLVSNHSSSTFCLHSLGLINLCGPQYLHLKVKC